MPEGDNSRRGRLRAQRRRQLTDAALAPDRAQLPNALQVNPQEQPSQVGQALRRSAQRPELVEESPTERAFAAGVKDLQAAGPGLGSAVAGSLGAEDAAQDLAEQAAFRQRQARRLTPDATRFGDAADSPGDALSFAAQTLAREGPGLAADIATGGVGGLAARGLRRTGQEAAERAATRAARREAQDQVGDVATREGRQRVNREAADAALAQERRRARSTIAGQAGTAALSNTAQEAGALVPAIQQGENSDDLSQQELSQRALAGSAASGLLGSAPALGALNRIGGRVSQNAAQRATQRGAREAAGRTRRVVSGGQQIGLEAGTEAAQAAITRGTQATINDNIETFDDEGLQQIGASAVGGGLLGGVTAAATATGGGAQQQPQRQLPGPDGDAGEGTEPTAPGTAPNQPAGTVDARVEGDIEGGSGIAERLQGTEDGEPIDTTATRVTPASEIGDSFANLTSSGPGLNLNLDGGSIFEKVTGRTQSRRSTGRIGARIARRQAAKGDEELANQAAQRQITRINERAPGLLSEIGLGPDAQAGNLDTEQRRRLSEADLALSRELSPIRRSQSFPTDDELRDAVQRTLIDAPADDGTTTLPDADVDSLVSNLQQQRDEVQESIDAGSDILNTPGALNEGEDIQGIEDQVAQDQVTVRSIDNAIRRIEQARREGDAAGVVDAVLDTNLNEDTLLNEQAQQSIRNILDANGGGSVADELRNRAQEAGQLEGGVFNPSSTSAVQGRSRQRARQAQSEAAADQLSVAGEQAERLSDPSRPDEGEGTAVVEPPESADFVRGSTPRGQSDPTNGLNLKFFARPGVSTRSDNPDRARELAQRLDAEDPGTSSEVVPLGEAIQEELRGNQLRERNLSRSEVDRRVASQLAQSTGTQDQLAEAESNEAFLDGFTDSQIREARAQIGDEEGQLRRIARNIAGQSRVRQQLRRESDSALDFLNKFNAVRQTSNEETSDNDLALTDEEISRVVLPLDSNASSIPANQRQTVRREVDDLFNGERDTMPEGIPDRRIPAIEVDADGNRRRRIIDTQQLVITMMDKLGFNEDATQASRIGEMVLGGLNSLATRTDGVRVDLPWSTMPENHVVFSSSPDDQGNRRDYTFGEIKLSGSAQIRRRMEALEQRMDQASGDRKKRLRDEFFKLKSDYKRARGRENADDLRNLLHYRSVLTNKHRHTDEEIAEAQQVVDQEADKRARNYMSQLEVEAQREQEAEEEGNPADSTETPFVQMGSEEGQSARAPETAFQTEQRFEQLVRAEDAITTTNPAQALAREVRKIRQAIRRVSQADTVKKARQRFENATGRKPAGNAKKDSLVSQLARLRDQRINELRNRSREDRNEAMRKGLEYATSRREAINGYELLFGETLPDNTSFETIRRLLDGDTSEADVLTEKREQPDPEQRRQRLQGIASTWAQKLGLEANVEVVSREGLADFVDDGVMEAVDRGDTAGFAAPADTDGRVRIHINESLSDTAAVETLAHEMGHVVYRERVQNLSEDDAESLMKAFHKWRAENDRDDQRVDSVLKSRYALQRAADSLEGKHKGSTLKDLTAEERDYLLAFDEWFADNVSRWLTQTKEPQGVVNRFFKDVADRIKQLMDEAMNNGAQFRADRSVAKFMRMMWHSRVSEQASEQATRAGIRNNMPELPPAVLNAIRQQAKRKAGGGGGTPYTPVERLPNGGRGTALIRRSPGSEQRSEKESARDNARHGAAFAEGYIDDPYSDDTKNRILDVYDNLLTSEERKVLGRAFSTPDVRSQLEKLIPDPAERASINNGNARLAVARGYQYWANNSKPDAKDNEKLEVSQKVDTIFKSLREAGEDYLGVFKDDTRAINLLQAMKQGRIEARRTGALPDESVVQRFRRATALDRTAETAVRMGEGLGQLMRFVRPASTRLVISGVPQLEALVDQMFPRVQSRGRGQSMFEARQAGMSRFFNEVDDATRELTQEEGRELLELMQNPDLDTDNPRVAKARDAMRTTMRRMREYALSKGLELGDRGEDYFPTVWDPAAILQNRQELINRIAQAKHDQFLGVDSDAEDAQAQREAAANRIVDALMQHDGYGDAQQTPADGGNTPFMASAHQRQLSFLFDNGSEEDRKALSQFLSKDLGQTMAVYIEQIVKRSEFAARFGVDGSRLEALLAQARQAGATDKQIEEARNFVSAVMGTMGRELHPAIRRPLEVMDKQLGTNWASADPAKWRKVQGLAIVYQNIRVLGMATLTSISDTAGLITRSDSPDVAFEGFKAGMKEVALTARRMADRGQSPEGTFDSELRRLARSLGTIDTHLVNEVLGEAFSGRYLTGNVRKANEAFFRVIQLQRWTRFSRMMGVASGRAYLKRLAEGQGPFDSGRQGQRFREQLGLREGDIKLDDDGELVILSNDEREALQGRAERLGDNAADAELGRDDRIRTAMNRFVDQAIMRPNATQRPIIGSHPDAQLFMHLNQFAFSIQTQIVNRVTNETKQGNMFPLAAVMSYVPIMIAADLLREFLQHGTEGDPRKQNWGFTDYTTNAIHRSGMLGAGTFLLDIRKDQTMGGLGYESILGPTLTHAQEVGSLLTNENADAASTFINSLPANNLYKNWEIDEILGANWETQVNTIGGRRE